MLSRLFARFYRDRRGNYAMMTVIAMVPIMGGLALAIDFTEMNRQREAALNALDATGIATGQRIRQGGTEAEINAYARSFFEANLGPVDPSNVTLALTLPDEATGQETLKLQADLRFQPYFLPTFNTLLMQVGTNPSTETPLQFRARSEVRLKNTLEVALVLDNSGSMNDNGAGSGEPRLKLLKTAAKELVTTLSQQAILMKQIDKPVQFGIVPFAASVNVGQSNAGESWIDRDGISPIHHENFDWTSMTSSYDSKKYAQKVGGIWYARGSKWGDHQDKKLTRLTIYDLMKRRTPIMESVCVKWNSRKTKCQQWGEQETGEYKVDQIASWGGCVEARPSPYNATDEVPNATVPASLFVPMFAPDETNNTDGSRRPANNNWRSDETSGTDAKRQAYMPKYFLDDDALTPSYGMGEGPNTSCTTQAITALEDVTKTDGKKKIDDAIDAMVASGATNVPEGLAWGWRVVSGGEPFTQGRPDTENGVDKVVIVLTDGANTYYTPGSVIAQSYSGSYYNYGGNDLAGSKAIYSSYGYMKPYNSAYTNGRLYQGTSSDISKSTFDNAEYGDAMNEQMAAVCGNAKGKNVIVMTVALDLSTTKEADLKQIAGLKACASESRYRPDPDQPGRGVKLFWNATGATLSKAFKEIADELSNLRIIG